MIVNTGGPVAMGSWKDKVPAIAQAFFPGQEGGTAIAEIVSGKVNPSGKLPITIPKKLEDSPSAAYYHGQEDFIDYSKTSVLEGYRGYDAKKIEPEFPFGHGLSYTSFKYSDLKVQTVSSDAANPKVKVSFKVTNSGKVKGAEAAQLYVGEESPEVTRAPKELKGFDKVALAPGESKTVSIELDAAAFRYWNDETHAWTIKPGQFKVLVGSSSRDIRLQGAVNLLAAKKKTASCDQELKALKKQKQNLTAKLREFSNADWFTEINEKLHIAPEGSVAPAADCEKELAELKESLANMRNVTQEFAKKFEPRLYSVEPSAAEAASGGAAAGAQ